MRELLLEYQWGIFIGAEVLSVIALLLFGVVRYWLGKRRFSTLFLGLFLFFLMMEAGMALYLYQITGEIDTFQIVVMIFLVYACTFGIVDFKKLDRKMRQKAGEWRGIELLAEKDITIMERQKDPKYIAKKYRYSSLAHVVVFVLAQVALWIYGTGGDMAVIQSYLSDVSWMEGNDYTKSPYPNEMTFNISQVWGIIFIVDLIYSWSFTLFPSKRK